MISGTLGRETVAVPVFARGIQPAPAAEFRLPGAGEDAVGGEVEGGHDGGEV
jgi:hypothetical protein